MKILWVHNFDPHIINSGVFMHQLHAYLAEEHLREIQVDIFYTGNLRNPLIVVCNIFRLIWLGRKYDIVHAQYGSMCGFVTSFSSAQKIITLRGSDWYKKAGGGWRVKLHNTFQNILTKICLGRYKKIIVVSERMKREVEKRLPRKMVIVIPSPVDLEKFIPMDQLLCRKDLNLPENEKIFLFPVMNKHNSVKRPWLIEAVKSQLPQGVKIITASGVPHKDMCKLYNAVDGVLLFSEYEGWPNVIKEALLCNTPFIATDVSDLSLISLNLKGCHIVEPDVERIRDLLMKFVAVEDDYRAAVSWMSLENMADRLVERCYLA